MLKIELRTNMSKPDYCSRPSVEVFLIPAQTTIIGYEVAPVAVMPEKAGEVEA